MLLLASCAQINPLSGGERDEFAPAIDSAGTHPYNGQLNFKDDQIVIKFDEFIRLVSPNDNILITPQPEVKPLITSKNKKLKIQFMEPLADETTYSINFNRAIADITEKNDSIFQFVFSTGYFIDSLSVSGTITDGFTNKPEKNFLLALYPHSDTISFEELPLKSKPMYIGQSDEYGEFELNYLKGGKYYLFAIQDGNKNLLLDGGEKLAFHPHRIDLISPTRAIQMKSYSIKDTVCRIQDKRFNYPGKLEIILSSEADSFDVKSTMPLLQEETDRKDSLIYWLSSNPTSKMRFYTMLNGELDTIRPVYKGVPDKVEIVDLSIQSNAVQGYLLPNENLILETKEPIDFLNPDLVHFYSADSQEVQIDYAIKNVRYMECSTAGTQATFVEIDSMGLTSVFGNSNQRKISVSFENREEDYFGSVTILVDSLVQEKILVELLENGKVINDTVPYGKSMRFDKLEPTNYQLRLIFDEDGDGKWSSGSIIDKKEPEKVIYYKGEIKVKSKWEKEIEWSIQY